MNKNKYLGKLEKQNGYCSCPQLGDLFEKRKTAEGLEAKCSFFQNNVDLENPQEDDRKFLEDYKEVVEELRQTVRQYYLELGKGVDEKKVKLFLHNSSRGIRVREITSEEAPKKGDSIVTYHCARCDQQIDIRAVTQSPSTSK